jgi:transglutaminase-like putative cysteine protease
MISKLMPYVMNRNCVILYVVISILFSNVLFQSALAESSNLYSYAKIEQYYKTDNYEKVLEQIRMLEQGRFGKNGKLKYSLRDDIEYYHYKLSARIKLNRIGSLRESTGLYDRLLQLDSARHYVSQPHYVTFVEHIKCVTETTLKKNQIGLTKTFVNVLARYGDTTWVYHAVYPRKESLNIVSKEVLWKFLKEYDYTQIDKKALATKKQSSIENQAWVLTKDYAFEFEKVRAIYIWITHNIKYDNSYTIYDGKTTFLTNTGVCSGYSSLFQEMCEKTGIKVYRVTGLANNGRGYGRHAWNLVEVEGQQFLLDTTWGVGTEYAANYYYLISEKELSKTHKIEEIR